MSARTLFITATDTDAGKTHVACALLRRLRAEGHVVCGYKPVASGCLPSAEGLRSDDALALQAASGASADYADLNPYAFAPAIAPHLAAAQVGVVIDPAVLDAAHARLAARCDWLIVEGAGGWLTPLDGKLCLGDWVGGRGWPVLLVVDMRLGCLNQALLSAEAIRRRAPLAGWVANVRDAGWPELAGNIQTLTQRLGPPLWTQGSGLLAPLRLDALLRLN